MTVAKMKRIALQLANTYWVRYYVCLNYPQTPQDVCISVVDHEGYSEGGRSPGRDSRHDRLMQEMNALGFKWETKYGITGFHATVEEAQDGKD